MKKINEMHEKIKKGDRQRHLIKKEHERQKPVYDRQTKELVLDVFNS